MIWTLLLSIALSQDPIVVQPATPPKPTTQPAGSQPDNLAGPTRVDLLGMQELRAREYHLDGNNPERANFGFKFGLRGERMPELVKFGSVVLTELTDDVGTDLIDPEVNAAALNETARRQYRPVEQLAAAPIELTVLRIKAPPRKASKFAKFRGYVRVLYTKTWEGLYFDNARALQGHTLEDPRLKALGIEIRILPQDDPEKFANTKRNIAYQILKGIDHVADIRVYDQNLREVRGRPDTAKTKAGEPCAVIMCGRDLVDSDLIVVEINEQLEEAKLPINLDGLAMP